MEKRLSSQMETVVQSKAALDAAIAAAMPALVSAKDRDLKRQTAALKATQDAIGECRKGILELDKAQLDMLEAARQENAEKAPPAPLKEVKPPHDARKR